MHVPIVGLGCSGALVESGEIAPLEEGEFAPLEAPA